jgi:hypothetical protein
MTVEPNTKGWRTTPSACIAGLIVVAVLMAKPAITSADEVSCVSKAPPSKSLCGVGNCLLCCPDDYIRKPTPCVASVSSCCPDTYCPKPCLVLPCPTKCCCPDDYCPKPHPSLCHPMANAWYKCVPLAPCHWRHPATCTGERD